MFYMKASEVHLEQSKKAHSKHAQRSLKRTKAFLNAFIVVMILFAIYSTTKFLGDQFNIQSIQNVLG